MKALHTIALSMLDLVSVREGGTVAEALAGLTTAKSELCMPPPWRVTFF